MNPARHAPSRPVRTKQNAMPDAVVELHEPGLTCPVCRVALVMSERQNIEIDDCPKCRGVWLDRGELDKIIERSPGSAPAEQPKAAAPQPARAAATVTLCAAAALALDQAGKALMLAVMQPPRVIPVTPFFNLTPGFNEGAGFGMLGGLMQGRRPSARVLA